MGNTESSSQFPARPPASRGRGRGRLEGFDGSSGSAGGHGHHPRPPASRGRGRGRLEGFNGSSGSAGGRSHHPRYLSHLGLADPNSNRNLLKIMSYNVWFREDLELNNRMDAIGDLIQRHSPDIICLQEVTPKIYDIFKRSTWWKTYKCSLSQEIASRRAYFCMQMSKLPTNFNCKPFHNTIMGRELCLADVKIGVDKKLVVATSHLESPCPRPPRWDQRFSKERVAQARMSIDLLKSHPNVIFCGDMNWDDELDAAFPLDDGWVDAWTQKKSGENGWTYDTKANPVLTGNRKLQKRLDRFVCNLRDFKIDSIDMIGMEAIPGLSHRKKVGKASKELVLPVLPSDHFGLLLTISRRRL